MTTNGKKRGKYYDHLTDFHKRESSIKRRNKYLQEIKKLAKERNIELLSTEYINNMSDLEFRCIQCQRTWKDFRANIMQKVQRNTFGCPYCNKKHKEVLFKEFQELAKERGGELLSKEFYGMTKYHRWKCRLCGCEWKAKPSTVKDYPSKKGSWCPDCGNESMRKNLHKYTLEDMQKLAQSKPGGGECLSKKYLGVRKDHLWKCGTCGYVWKAKPTYIMGKPTRPNGSWCPRCAQGRQERVCRAFFEAIFGMKFPPEHDLEWLRKHDMHLDGYNKELKLAFERQGIQHYRFHEFFHKNDHKLFEKRKELDEYKRVNCKKNGIMLIEIGYEWRNGKLHKIRIDEMEAYIRKKCIEQDVIPPESEKSIDWRKFDVSQPEHVIELQELAKKKNGKLLSTNYFGEAVKLHWYCNEHKHDWWAPPCDIRGKPSKPNGTWCPMCGKELYRKAMKRRVKERTRDKNGRFIN
jgi:hypothetical protein